MSRCESSGRWHLNSPPYYGGLQEALPTWQDYGGLTFAPRPDLATRPEQVTVAERILAGQGPDAWPVCHIWLKEAA